MFHPALPVWLRLCQCWSPLDGTAAKSSRFAATNYTCQLQLPKEKVQMYLFHPGSEGFFSAPVLRGQMQGMWHTERISITDKLTGQRATIPTSVRGDSHFKSLPYSNYTLIALKAQMITTLVISNQKLSIFVASPSLCWGCLGYGPSKRQHILFTITTALLWLSKRRIASISLWRIECICIVESLVSSSEQIYCPSLSLSPLDCISVYWAQ